MIGLQKSIMAQIFSNWLGFPCMVQSLSTIYDMAAFILPHIALESAREQRGLANVSAAWRKFTWIKSSEKQDSMKVTWPWHNYCVVSC
jgi:hypothetical protein